MKQFNDFRIFKKVVRKYWKRYASKSFFWVDGKRYTSWWVADNIWCCYLVKSNDELKNKAIKDWFKYDIEEFQSDDYLNTYGPLIGSKQIFENYQESIEGIFNGFLLVNNGVLMLITDNKDNQRIINLSYHIK